MFREAECEAELVPQSAADFDPIAQAHLEREQHIEQLAHVPESVTLAQKVRYLWDAYGEMARADARGDLAEEYRHLAELGLEKFITAGVIPTALVRTWRLVPLDGVRTLEDFRSTLTRGWHLVSLQERTEFLQMLLGQLHELTPAVAAKLSPSDAEMFLQSWNEAWMHHSGPLALGIIAMVSHDESLIASLAKDFGGEKLKRPLVSPVKLDPQAFAHGPGVSLTRDLTGLERDFEAIRMDYFTPAGKTELEKLTPKDPAVFFAYYQQLAQTLDRMDMGTIFYLNALASPKKRKTLPMYNPWGITVDGLESLRFYRRFYRDMPQALRDRLWARELELRRVCRAQYEFIDLKDEPLRMRLWQVVGDGGAYDAVEAIRTHLAYALATHLRWRDTRDTFELDALGARARQTTQKLRDLSSAPEFDRVAYDETLTELHALREASAELRERWRAEVQ